MDEHEKLKREKLRESWIESLVVSATRPPSNADRVARAMSQIEADQVAPHSIDRARRRTRFFQSGAIAVAAAVLLGLFLLVPSGGTPSAMAAIQRSLDVAAEQTTRKYLLQIQFQSRDGQKDTIDNDLYVQGRNRFAIRHPGLVPGTNLWLGRDGAESWIVLPIGPIFKGDKTMVRRWIRSQNGLDRSGVGLDTPYLHVTTILRCMSRGYHLETLEDEGITIPGGGPFTCQHIRAERKSPEEPNLPETIDLWASRESGMAVRLIARWELEDGEIGRKAVILTFLNEESSLSRDWFTAEGHYDGPRPIIRMNPPRN